MAAAATTSSRSKKPVRFGPRRDVVQGGGFIGTVDSAEPAVLVTLPMGNYTAIVRGVGAMPTGLALLEIYPQ
jgi:hypothetical protein